jgi:hypothetical protein
LRLRRSAEVACTIVANRRRTAPARNTLKPVEFRGGWGLTDGPVWTNIYFVTLYFMPSCIHVGAARRSARRGSRLRRAFGLEHSSTRFLS